MKNNIIALWFVPINSCLKPISLQEIKWKKKLSNNRAIQYEHSRGHVREVLSHILEIPALEIPLISPPGMPPELPEGMGYLSFSHCSDALILVWHAERIGIDIERIDRDFNYAKLAKKYFFNANSYKTTSEFYKNSILNQWCAVEAAIKWDHGKLAEDIKEWQYSENDKILFHKKKKLKLKFTQINLDKWTISLAYKDTSHFIPNIICSSKMV